MALQAKPTVNLILLRLGMNTGNGPSSVHASRSCREVVTSKIHTLDEELEAKVATGSMDSINEELTMKGFVHEVDVVVVVVDVVEVVEVTVVISGSLGMEGMQPLIGMKRLSRRASHISARSSKCERAPRRRFRVEGLSTRVTMIPGRRIKNPLRSRKTARIDSENIARCI